MPDNIQPTNPNIPAVPSQPGNVASLVNKDTLTNLKGSLPPKSFGDQLPKMAASAAIAAASQSTLAKLEIEKVRLIQEGVQLDIKHQQSLLKLQLQNTPTKKVVNGQTVDIPPQLNDEEYAKAVDNENKNYEEAKKNLQIRKDKNKKDIQDYINDPFAKQKEAKKKRKDARAKRKARTKAEKTKARKEKRKSVLKNLKKSLVPTLTLLLTDKIAAIIAQNDKIKKLVDDTNKIIEEANISNIQTQLDNAKLARDNAIRVIQNNEDKIRKILNQIKTISKYISIFSIIVTIISAIPIPTSVPPGIGIPVNLIMKFVKILDKANRILLTLSAFLPTITASLDKAIAILEDYKAQLQQINGIIDPIATPPQIDFGTGAGTSAGFDEYKGFRFALKEENSPDRKFTIRGNKRHYAVAINKQNVEVLKSDLSFTLDPDDLIEQLKLTIDQQELSSGTEDSNNPNLRAGNSDNDVMDFMKANSPENIGKDIGSINTLVSNAQQQQQTQAATTNNANKPLTKQQKDYYTQVYYDFNKPSYERQNAKAILDRNYI